MASSSLRSPRTSRTSEAPGPEAGLTALVGANLRALRGRRGLSLARLAEASGVSRAMLSQIELGQSAPTINVLWKITTALGVPFSALMEGQPPAGPAVLRARDARLLTNQAGTFVSRPLFSPGGRRRVEFYELRLAARGAELAEAHAPGTRENLVVVRGTVEIEAGGTRSLLQPGDAISFDADGPHAYRNRGARPAVMYLVMSYAAEVG